MSDFNGKPLVFRDDIEREFWGRVYASGWAMRAATSTYKPVDFYADNAVVGMRIRQKVCLIEQPPTERFPSGYTAWSCAVCASLVPVGAKLPTDHVDGCPLGETP